MGNAVLGSVWPYLGPWDAVRLRTASTRWNVPGKYAAWRALFLSPEEGAGDFERGVKLLFEQSCLMRVAPLSEYASSQQRRWRTRLVNCCIDPEHVRMWWSRSVPSPSCKMPFLGRLTMSDYGSVQRLRVMASEIKKWSFDRTIIKVRRHS